MFFLEHYDQRNLIAPFFINGLIGAISFLEKIFLERNYEIFLSFLLVIFCGFFPLFSFFFCFFLFFSLFFPFFCFFFVLFCFFLLLYFFGKYMIFYNLFFLPSNGAKLFPSVPLMRFAEFVFQIGSRLSFWFHFAILVKSLISKLPS